MSQVLINGSQIDVGMSDRIMFMGWDYSGTTGAWSTISGATYAYRLMTYNTTNANNDQVDFLASFSNGTYMLRIIFTAEPSSALVKLFVDDIDTGKTINLYAAGENLYAILDLTGIVLTAGHHKISLRAGIGAGGGYYIAFYSFTMWRTA